MATWREASRLAALAVAAGGAGLLLPAGCLFPTYTFDLGNGGGGNGTTTSSSTTSNTGGTGSTTSTTSSSTTTSLGGGGTGTTTTTSSSSTTTGEPCTVPDCSNPNCATTYSCVAGAPAGWTGYFALYDGAPAGDPGCPAAFPTSAYVGNAQLSSMPAMCSACTCTAPVGQLCRTKGPADTDPMYPNTIDIIQTLDVACGNAPNCSGILQVPNNWDGTCYGPNGFPAGASTCGPNAGAMCTMGTQPCTKALQTGALVVTGGTCTPSQQTPTLPPPSWAKAGEACTGAVPAAKGCNAGASCLPKPEAPFETGVCIQKAGDNSCPPGQFTQKHLFHTGVDDQRTCSDCDCGAAAGGACSATITVYSASTVDNCTGLVATLTPTTQAGACVNLTGNPAASSRKAVFSAVSGGACPAGGGQPGGTIKADAATATTFCCIP